MQRIIVNHWEKTSEGEVEFAQILHHDRSPEGFDFFRVRFVGDGRYLPSSDFGMLASVLGGEVSLHSKTMAPLRMVGGTHAYLPPGSQAEFHGTAGSQLVLVQAPSASRARGERVLVRDDQFLSACAGKERALRWILTPQYLSRRVFLHHDKTLRSVQGDPISWFHTTMFDVDGLPANEDGEPVFKMSYNFRTEPNVCYEVKGQATVRMAEHPYQDKEQRWGPWHAIDDQTTYHLSEDATHSEWRPGPHGPRPRRNKHEVRILSGHVSLMCMHDPAPTGAERHAAGEYSEYGDLANTLGTPGYKDYLAELQSLDQMVDVLSLAKARGDEALEKLPEWATYQAGKDAQRASEAALLERLQSEGQGREQILRSWMLNSDT